MTCTATTAAIAQASPAEVLALPRQSLTVRHGEEVTMDPANPQFRDHFRQVVASRFADLQTLMLVPQGLREDKVLAAIRQDDDDALELSERHFDAKAVAPCGCSDRHVESPAGAPDQATTQRLAASAKRDVGLGMQGAYRRVRAARHKALARELSDAHGKVVAWDSLEARMTYGIVRRFYEVAKLPILTVLFQDIEVFNNSTLNLYPTHSLYANHVRIHADGKIKSTSSYLKFFCFHFTGNLP